MISTAKNYWIEGISATSPALKAFFLEVGPERAGYISAQPGQVLAHFLWRNWSWDYRHDGRMPEGELQGRRGQRHVVTPADGRDAFHLTSGLAGA
jgi:hypothetical protein